MFALLKLACLALCFLGAAVAGADLLARRARTPRTARRREESVFCDVLRRAVAVSPMDCAELVAVLSPR